MSAEYFGVVLRRYAGKPHLKLTLLVLADAADAETGECWPSYESIAGQAGVTRSTAIRNVRSLMDDGLVEVVDRGGFRTDPATGRQVFVSNVYRVRLEALRAMPDWRDRKKLEACAQPVDNSLHGSAGATVSVAPVRPCHGSAGATLTVSEEPSDRTVSSGGARVENTRDRRWRERRGIRSTIARGLLGDEK